MQRLLKYYNGEDKGPPWLLLWQKDTRKRENLEIWEQLNKHERNRNKNKNKSDRNIKGKGCYYSWLTHYMITFYYNCNTKENWTHPNEVNPPINNQSLISSFQYVPVADNMFLPSQAKQKFIPVNLSTQLSPFRMFHCNVIQLAQTTHLACFPSKQLFFSSNSHCLILSGT